MKTWSSLLAVTLLVTTAACGTDTNEADTSGDTGATAMPAERPAAEVDTAGDAAAGVLLDINESDVGDLRAAGISDPVATALAEGRPFRDMLAVDAALSGVLDEAGREELYKKAWIPIDLNTASREEILLIPGVGDRMVREFEEYRPYKAMAQFRREIGKYVDDAEVERLAQYVTIADGS